MADQWIKLEHGTPDKPEVVAMAALLRIDQDAVVGKLVRLWVWADQNSVDGAGMPITEAFIDRLTNKKGFAKAMRSRNWLSGDDGALMFANFSRHNGTTAKARATENRRKSDWREREKLQGEFPQVVPHSTGFNACDGPENVPSGAGHFTGPNAPGKRGPDEDEDEEERAKALSSDESASPPVARAKLFESLAKAEGSKVAQLTRIHRAKIDKALDQMIEVDSRLTPEEITLRAKIYPFVMPAGTKLTAMGLAMNWAKCEGERPRAPVAEPRDWRARLEVVFPGNAITSDMHRTFATLDRETWQKVLAFESKPGARIA